MTAPAIGARPYIGLRYFEERDAHLFYGRDEHTADLLAKLAGNRFVAVMGSSGCGKSSLVRAGLLPELRSGMIPNAGPSWEVVEFKPGTSPLGALADAMQTRLDVPHAHELVQEGPLGIVRAIAAANLPPGTNILVIADQFEELFRFQREEANQGRGTEALEQCRAFVRSLLDAANQSEWPIYVLLVMRSDYLGECSQFPELPERMSENLYLVPRLRRDQLEEAITAPVGGEIEPAVVQRLLSEVGSDPDQLPRLQHLLGRMWDQAKGGRLTMDHYSDAGGWDTGLQQHLEEIYEPLSDSQKLVCQRVFQQLSELDKGRAVRRRAAIEDLMQVCGPETGNVVGRFRDEGFLLPQLDPVDITHECVLRAWSRCRDWVTDEGKARVFYRELVVRKDRPGHLHRSDLREVSRQRQAGRFTEQWALRYGTPDDFEGVERYVYSSRKAQLWARTLVTAVVTMLVIYGSYSIRSTTQLYKERARTQSSIAQHQTELARSQAAIAQNQTELAGARARAASDALLALARITKAQEDLKSSLTTQEGIARDARARELTAHAAMSLSEDPARSLYLGLRSAQLVRPLPPGLESVLADGFNKGPSLAVFRGQHAGVNSVAWSPDGKTMASGGVDASIRLWDADAVREVRTLVGHKSSVASIAWSPDGRTMASASDDSTIRLWAVATGESLRVLFGHEGAVYSVAWSPDGKKLATAGSDETIRLWEAASGRPLHCFTRSEQSTVPADWLSDLSELLNRKFERMVSWSPDGTMLASSGFRETIQLWEVATGQLINTLTGHGRFVNSVAWSPDGKSLASASHDSTIRVWEAASGQPIRTLAGHQGAVTQAAWSPDGRLLASASLDRTVHLWEAATGLLISTLIGHQESVNTLAWSPDGKTLASSSGDDTIRLWEVPPGEPLRTLADSPTVFRVAWSPDSRLLASTIAIGSTGIGSDPTIRLWDAATTRCLRSLTGHTHVVTSVAWSPDDRTLASGSADKTIRLWEAASGNPIRTITGHEASILGLAWCPEGKTLASAGNDGTIQLWEAATGQLLRTLAGHEASVIDVAWSPDGNTLASASRDKSVRLWEATTSRLISKLTGHDDSVVAVSWSPDGKRLASASEDSTIRLWDAATGRHLLTIAGHAGEVGSVAWSPDSNTLASSAGDGRIRHWDATTGAPLRVLGGSYYAYRVAWSPDGKTLASIDPSLGIRLWPGTVEGLIEQARHAIRLYSLSEQDCQRYFNSTSCPPIR